MRSSILSKRASRLAAVTALACGLLLPTARESAADTVKAVKAVMYEVTETLVLKPTVNPNDGDAIARRMADASLLGNDVQVTEPASRPRSSWSPMRSPTST